jgi:xanthine dehydrogenase iron-sulfur cluster and FAD-binding subunit A
MNLHKAQPEMILTFEWDGKTVNKETIGFTGKTCTEKTAFIEEALHGKNLKRSFKKEYVQADQQRTDRLRY